MKHTGLGGNTMRVHDIDREGAHALAAGPYLFDAWSVPARGRVEIPGDGERTAYLFQLEGRAMLRRARSSRSGRSAATALHTGDAVRTEGESAVIEVGSGRAIIVVAGVLAKTSAARGVTVTKAGDLKRVVKPWGHEIWVTGESPRYALKEIAIRAGTRTSLQFHRKKRETIVLFSGRARLHFLKRGGAPPDRVRAEDIEARDFGPVTSVDVAPGTVHRLEALTDVIFCEASTPELDDVVRLQDDAGRPDGRIDAEHRASGDAERGTIYLKSP
jgi:hypothetical protein